jgi:hypothetical protein
MLSTLLEERTKVIGRAQALMSRADEEVRDLTRDERTAFHALLDFVDRLDVRIGRLLDPRAPIGNKHPAIYKPEKPASANANIMKRGDFDRLNPGEQAAFIKGNGKIVD